MINREDFTRQVQPYSLVMLKGAWDGVLGQIAAIPEGARRQEAQSLLEELWRQILAMDLSGFGWRPRNPSERGTRTFCIPTLSAWFPRSSCSTMNSASRKS